MQPLRWKSGSHGGDLTSLPRGGQLRVSAGRRCRRWYGWASAHSMPQDIREQACPMTERVSQQPKRCHKHGECLCVNSPKEAVRTRSAHPPRWTANVDAMHVAAPGDARISFKDQNTVSCDGEKEGNSSPASRRSLDLRVVDLPTSQLRRAFLCVALTDDSALSPQRGGSRGSPGPSPDPSRSPVHRGDTHFSIPFPSFS